MRVEELLRCWVCLCSKDRGQLTVSPDVLLRSVDEVLAFFFLAQYLEGNAQVAHGVSMCLEILHALIEL